jgi:hypothetical protein
MPRLRMIKSLLWMTLLSLCSCAHVPPMDKISGNVCAYTPKSDHVVCSELPKRGDIPDYDLPIQELEAGVYMDADSWASFQQSYNELRLRCGE